MKLREAASIAIIIWLLIAGVMAINDVQEFCKKNPTAQECQPVESAFHIFNDRSEGWPDGNKN